MVQNTVATVPPGRYKRRRLCIALSVVVADGLMTTAPYSVRKQGPDVFESVWLDFPSLQNHIVR